MRALVQRVSSASVAVDSFGPGLAVLVCAMAGAAAPDEGRRLSQISQFSQFPVMKTLTATDARNRFGELIDMAQVGPVRVQRQGRDVAVVLSPAEFRRLSEAASGRVNPAVERLHAESAKRWAKVYAALAG